MGMALKTTVRYITNLNKINVSKLSATSSSPANLENDDVGEGDANEDITHRHAELADVKPIILTVCLCAVLMCRAVVASSSQSFKNCPTKPVQANFNFTRVGTSGRVRYGGYVWVGHTRVGTSGLVDYLERVKWHLKEMCPYLSGEGVRNYLEKTTLSTPGQDLNPDLQVSGKADKARLVTSWPLFSVQFQGLWYELRRQPNAFEPDSVCVTGDVAVTPQGGLTIVNRWYNTVSSQHVLLNGVLRRANNDSQDGRLIVKFTNTS
uniref:(California timema) hypothetical protein n=1 Tax=Timema californicum TaxID=61474 RepID=A0A7R9JCT7_TIMCA|nr:unnamed protein product [Timema californicum]